MEPTRTKQPLVRRNDDRIVVHFDYDCFYAQVIEHQRPALKAQPLGIKQKSILATCNYAARRRGVRKLMPISEAKKICPELVLADGEDLSAFRDVSKRLYGLLRACCWSGKVERLGLDEVFLDVTDLVDYNVALLNAGALDRSFFCLSRTDPEQGFSFDARAVAGCVWRGPSWSAEDAGPTNLAYVRLLVASHLASHLRARVEDEEGYTAACGISINKLLAKLVGCKNKPRNQTTLLALADSDVLAFMDAHVLRQVPGIGAKIAFVLESHKHEIRPGHTDEQPPLTAGQVRTHAGASPQRLETWLGGPGAEKGIGDKVWGLLHGVDPSEVKAASDVPTQISIEDTYAGLNDLAEIERELRLLAASLLRRMRIDLVEESDEDRTPGAPASEPPRRWIAHPRTLRLSTRPKPPPGEDRPYGYGRASRSQPLPNFVFGLASAPEQLAERLVAEALLPMFRRLHPEAGGWRVGLLNVCVAGMVLSGSDDARGGAGTGRDISAMFRRQEEVLREWTVYDPEPPDTHEMQVDERGDTDGPGEVHMQDEISGDGDVDWEDGGCGVLERCGVCGHSIPEFAVLAHQRYHSMED